ncbi:MAG TPA: hypothetical protein VIF35_08805, partial [Streptosporangiaceae bacterium]
MAIAGVLARLGAGGAMPGEEAGAVLVLGFQAQGSEAPSFMPPAFPVQRAAATLTLPAYCRHAGIVVRS